MPIALRNREFEAPRLCGVGLGGRLDWTKSHFDCRSNGLLYYAACFSAFSYAEVFHRDASLGNVMIGPDSKGRLNDWDLCRSIYTNESLEGPRTVRYVSYVTALAFTPIYREPGSLCLLGYSQSLGRGTP